MKQKSKANQILRDATDEAKRVAVETEDLKRQTRVFHQRLVAAIEGQLGLTIHQNGQNYCNQQLFTFKIQMQLYREVVEKVLEEEMPETDDEMSMDATRQFTPEENGRIATSC